jgi:hypothetical protein
MYRNGLIGHYKASQLSPTDHPQAGLLMFRLIPAVALLMTGLAGSVAIAQDNPVVVELYTSQGCSSCPPADVILEELAQMDGVIPLALHVDYWDYIGWADHFARPEFTKRQHDYAVAAGERTVFTPQFMIGGLDAVVGADPMAVMNTIRDHADSPTGISLDLARDGATLRIRATAASPQDGPLRVQLVRYDPSETVSIERGENAGHVMKYVNIVTSWEVVGEWRSGSEYALDVPVMGSEPLVVIVQSAGPGRIMAAAVLR